MSQSRTHVAGPALGTSPTVTGTGDDNAFVLTITVGSSPTTGTAVTSTLTTNYNSVLNDEVLQPKITALNAAAVALTGVSVGWNGTLRNQLLTTFATAPTAAAVLTFIVELISVP